MVNHESHRWPPLGNDHVIDIDGVDEEDVAAENHHELRTLFYVGTKEREEGQGEVEEDEEETDEVPVFGVPKKEVTSLLGDVSIPDQEELGERNVGPEDGEGEAELAHNMVVLLGDNLVQVAGLLKKESCQDEHRHGRQG